MQISKSEYLMFLKHPALLWYKKHDKNKLPPVDANLQAIFDAGNLFESYAEQLFEDGIKLGFNAYSEYLSLPIRTQKAIQEGHKTIFQGRFETKDITCICDVIEMTGDKSLNLIEIKSGTSVKEENIYDLAFQCHVINLCGYEVDSIQVVTVNGQYIRNGEISVRELCNITDVTVETKELIPETIELIAQALEFAKRKEAPAVDPPEDGEGDLNSWLDLYLFNNKVEKGSIFDLCWPKNRVAQLYSMGINSLKDIPDDFPLSPKQKLQVQASKTDQMILDKKLISDFIGEFQFPLYFLDYETLAGVVPAFDGLGPYKQLPFQYSLHVLREPNGELEHYTYLHKENTSPVDSLSESLASHIGDEGTILTWNEKFEMGCNDLMAKISPKHKKLYKQINSRIKDLCVPFQKTWYVHKDFVGSYSIKKVLPVLVPELSYSDLDINEGAGAQRLWMQSVIDQKPGLDKEKILADLEKYCELDTLAMVKIYDRLLELASREDSNIEVDKVEEIEKLSLF